MNQYVFVVVRRKNPELTKLALAQGRPGRSTAARTSCTAVRCSPTTPAASAAPAAAALGCSQADAFKRLRAPRRHRLDPRPLGAGAVQEVPLRAGGGHGPGLDRQRPRFRRSTATTTTDPATTAGRSASTASPARSSRSWSRTGSKLAVQVRLGLGRSRRAAARSRRAA